MDRVGQTWLLPTCSIRARICRGLVRVRLLDCVDWRQLAQVYEAALSVCIRRSMEWNCGGDAIYPISKILNS